MVSSSLGVHPCPVGISATNGSYSADKLLWRILTTLRDKCLPLGVALLPLRFAGMVIGWGGRWKQHGTRGAGAANHSTGERRAPAAIARAPQRRKRPKPHSEISALW